MLLIYYALHLMHYQNISNSKHFIIEMFCMCVSCKKLLIILFSTKLAIEGLFAFSRQIIKAGTTYIDLRWNLWGQQDIY